jgi:DNA-binding CsgD family transcriptional regulator
VDPLALELSRGQTVAVLNNSHRKKNPYPAFLTGIKVYHEVRMVLRNDNEMLGFISLKRCSEDKYYTPEELGSLRSLSVLMSKLVYPLWAIGCSLPLKGLELALESCNVGIIMCDSNLQILFSNRHAEEICRILETSPNPVKAFVKRVSARLRSGFTATVVSASGDLFTLRAFCGEDLGQPGISLLCLYPETVPAAEDGASAVTSLTPREREIVGLLSQGLSTREIAGLLWISEHTVKVHLKHIYRKAGVTTRAQLLGKLLHTRSSPAVLVVSR